MVKTHHVHCYYPQLSSLSRDGQEDMGSDSHKIFILSLLSFSSFFIESPVNISKNRNTGKTQYKTLDAF